MRYIQKKKLTQRSFKISIINDFQNLNLMFLTRLTTHEESRHEDAWSCNFHFNTFNLENKIDFALLVIIIVNTFSEIFKKSLSSISNFSNDSNMIIFIDEIENLKSSIVTKTTFDILNKVNYSICEQSVSIIIKKHNKLMNVRQ